MSRNIVVIEKQILFRNFTEYFNGFVSEIGFYGIDDCHEARVRNTMLMEKDKSETSSTHKQIIPYILVCCPDENKLMTYRRALSGGDARLRGLLSIGVGGHIEKTDIDASLTDTNIKCVTRELREEIGLEGMSEGEIEDQLIHAGYVNEDETPVGKVHFGLVYVLNISKDIMDNGIRINDEETLHEVQFITFEELKAIDPTNMEFWTRLVAPFVHQHLI